MPTRWRCPPDSPTPPAATTVDSPSGSRSANSVTSAASATAATSSLVASERPYRVPPIRGHRGWSVNGVELDGDVVVGAPDVVRVDARDRSAPLCLVALVEDFKKVGVHYFGDRWLPRYETEGVNGRGIDPSGRPR